MSQSSHVIRVFVGAAVAAVVLLVPSVALASEQLIVVFEDNTTRSEKISDLRDAGVAVPSSTEFASAEIPQLDAAAIEVSDASADAVIAELEADPNVAYVEEDGIATIAGAPNDPYYAQQWWLSKISAAVAWDTATGSGITVAVVDTGVSHGHGDLSGQVILGKDYVEDDMTPQDPNGHGTHVSGIIAAKTNNGAGIASTAPGARILAVRVLDANGSGSYSDIAAGITWAADNGADVINLSLGGDADSTTLHNAVNYAVNNGVVVTCASGNDNTNFMGYPASYGSCFAVGATNSSDTRASFSNYGNGIDITAPGAGILSTVPGGSYESWSGTSMATPVVSGLVAQLMSQGLTGPEAVSTIKSTAKDLGSAGYDTYYGWGRIDADDAVAAAAGGGGGSADAVAPTINGITMGPTYSVQSTVRASAWDLRRDSGWVTKGTGYYGSYSWGSTKYGSTWKEWTKWRVTGGKLQKRIRYYRKITVYKKVYLKARDLTIDATDDTAVDRVGLSLNGTWVASDTDGTNGWQVRWICKPGATDLSFTGYSWDGANNEATQVYYRAEPAC